MRKIKFRAWDVDTREMEYESLLTLARRSEDLDEEVYHLMQYTGLKDKSGLEIYEGDILREESDIDEYTYEVRYFGAEDYPAFDVVPDLGAGSNGLSHLMANAEIEVIGNIHENPELLKISTS